MADDHNVTDIYEQPVFNHTRNLVQHQCQLTRVADPLQMQVQNVVALIRHQRPVAIHPQGHIARQHIHRHQHFLDQSFRGLPAKRNDLNRQWKRPQLLHFLRRICDDDHQIGRGRHNLFLQQSSPTALDQRQLLVKLIRAVNRHVQPFRLIQRGDMNANLPRQLGSAGRGRHPHNLQPLLAHPLAQTAHHPSGSRSGAQPHLHAIFNEIYRAFGGDELGFVDGGKIGWHLVSSV